MLAFFCFVFLLVGWLVGSKPRQINCARKRVLEQITANLNWLVRMLSDLETQVVSVERVKEYTELDTEVSDHDITF